MCWRVCGNDIPGVYMLSSMGSFGITLWRPRTQKIRTIVFVHSGRQFFKDVIAHEHTIIQFTGFLIAKSVVLS
jgi:hypothetical protein